ncbi:DUF262 domain-containing protein [Jeongeupia chitinilytica]|uniref:GmrSD restriction endonucleases N-terminal domain-containing protein n=1 Tax=Jeongeupia chitinilytica TaxID=1041641 RepID=A0ABQ3H0V6_9NEIS|nr:DUF262 domain-containing protein [Jeongeupia chitinilytica]GHD60281.1 hypothetical protein GCM10007350_13070 [Jeongeupia chitinilytica]
MSINTDNSDFSLPENEPEGIDTSQPTGWGSDYPLDAVFVRSEQRTVVEVVKRINAKRYQLDPEFQRDFVWPVTNQSRLIESCIMRIPLPVFYVAESPDGRIAVVDGLQRLTSFHRFLNGDFALVLKTGEDQPHHPLDGKKFDDLPIQLQERIEDTQLTLYILDVKAPERAKLDIFERVNSGSPLTRQQMRNCLFNGPATQWLKNAAGSPEFLSTSGRSLQPKTMRDREAINRFCAFYLLGESSYRNGDMDEFLARALKHMNENADELDQLSIKFTHSMQANKWLFKGHAFRKSLAGNSEFNSRSVLNIALFDVFSVLLADFDVQSIKEHADELRDAARRLIGEPSFNHSITYSTNSKRQVYTRFDMARNAIEEVFL